MPSFQPEQYIILALVFALGLVLGMYLLAGGKWKGRYREEVRRREALETELRTTERMPPGDIIVDERHHTKPAVTATERQPVRRRGGLLGFGRATR